MHFTQGYRYLLLLLLPFAVLLVSLPIVPLSGYVRTPGDHECHAWEAAAHLATLSTVVYGLCNNYVNTARQIDSTSYQSPCTCRTERSRSGTSHSAHTSDGSHRRSAERLIMKLRERRGTFSLPQSIFFGQPIFLNSLAAAKSPCISRTLARYMRVAAASNSWQF